MGHGYSLMKFASLTNLTEPLKDKLVCERPENLWFATMEEELCHAKKASIKFYFGFVCLGSPMELWSEREGS